VKDVPMMEAVRATLCSSTDSLANRHTTKNSNFAPGLVVPTESDFKVGRGRVGDAFSYSGVKYRG
jgi:hypothetical protein